MSVGNIDVIATPCGAGIGLDVDKLDVEADTHDPFASQEVPLVQWLLTRQEAQYLAYELLGAHGRLGEETEQQRAWREDTDGRYSGTASCGAR